MPCEVVWKKAEDDDGDDVDNSDNDDDKTKDSDDDDNLNEIDSSVDVWKLDLIVIVLSLTESL